MSYVKSLPQRLIWLQRNCWLFLIFQKAFQFLSLEHFCAYKYSIFSTDLKEEYKNLSSAKFFSFSPRHWKDDKKKKKKLTSQNTCILVTQINLSNIEYMFLFTVSSIIVFLQITIFNLNVIKIYACL